ncbi:hypothetical protein KKE60_04875 [Patescibacteria group bacterium]|nr:hypothetical protein [Patescibacteria group bacterium]
MAKKQSKIKKAIKKLVGEKKPAKKRAKFVKCLDCGGIGSFDGGEVKCLDCNGKGKVKK